MIMLLRVGTGNTSFPSSVSQSRPCRRASTSVLAVELKKTAAVPEAAVGRNRLFICAGRPHSGIGPFHGARRGPITVRDTRWQAGDERTILAAQEPGRDDRAGMGKPVRRLRPLLPQQARGG